MIPNRIKLTKHVFRKTKLTKAIKAAVPIIAMLGGGAVASTRNQSSSFNGQRFKKISAVYVDKTNDWASVSSPELNVPEKQKKRSAFAAFTHGKTKKNQTAHVKVDSEALGFLKSNNLLTMGNSAKAKISGNTLTWGRKEFAHTLNSATSSFAEAVCSGPAYTRFQYSTNAGVIDICTGLVSGGPNVYGANQAQCQLIHASCNPVAHGGGNAAPEFDDVDNAIVLTLNEDAGATNIADGGNGIEVTDTDVGDTLTWTTTGAAPTKGTVTLTGSRAATGGAGDLPFTTYTYTPNLNATGADSFTVRVSDGSLTDDIAIVVNIAAQNDDPTESGTFPTDITVTEESASNLDFSGLTLADVDSAGNNVVMTFTASAGTLNAVGGTVGGDGTAVLTLTDTIANIDTYLNTTTNITYTGATDDTGNDAQTVTVKINDGGNLGAGGGGDVALGAVNMDITATNDTGSLNLDFDDSSGAGGNNFSISYNAGGSAVTIADTDVTITDVDDTNMESGQILLSGGVLDGGSESISISGTPGTVGGVTITYTSVTQIDLSGSATLSDYQDVIESVIYVNGAAITSVSAGARTVTAKVNDGDIDTNTATSTITVVAAPQITSATYDEDTKTLVVTGVNFIANGGGDDVDVTKITFTGEAGGTYTLTGATANVEIDSATQFTVILAGADITNVEALINLNGTSPDTGAAYNIAVGDDFITAYTDGTTSDTTGNAITASGLPSPAITSATYDYSTGDIVVTGVDFEAKTGAANDVTAISFTITGEDGSTYGLTDTLDVDRDSATQFTLDLSVNDEAGVNAIINKDGTNATGSQAYNIAAADNFMAEILVGNTAGASNAITISNVITPTITSATYDGATGVFAVTGANIPNITGATNDIDASVLTFTGEGNVTYTLVGSSDVERASATSFSITLDATDKAEVQKLINKAGLTATGGATYNLAGAEDWAKGADAAVNVVDNTGNAVTVSNVPVPAITSATYSENSKALVVTGVNFVALSGAANDIDVTTLTFAGEAGGTHTLTAGQTSDVEITSATSFTVTVAGTDVTNLELLLNANGTQSQGATTYNLDAADDFNAGNTDGVTSDSTNAVTVSGWPQPTITSATYDSTTGLLVVTGIDFTANGAGFDVDASLFTFTGEDGTTYQLTDTTDVNITNATTFTIDISTSATDYAAVNALINKDGASATGGQAYNIGAADNFMTIVTGGDTSDTTGNAITVSNVVAPAITAVAYNASTGVLSVTGTDIPNLTGGGNDIDASKFTFTGEGAGGTAYTLVGTSDVERTSATSFALMLDVTDKATVQKLINKNGLTSTSGTAYNLTAAEDWAKGADAAVNVVSATNATTVSNVPGPSISSATYDSSTEVLVVTGQNMLKKTATNDIDVSKLTFTGEGGGTYNLSTSAGVELIDSTSFSLTLTGGDIAGVENLLHINGITSDSGHTYNLAAAEDWNTGADAAVNIADGAATVTVSGYPVPNISSATYNANTGTLVVAGANLESKTGGINDIDVSALTFTGQGGAFYKLTTATDVESTATEFTVILAGADKTAVDNIMNKNGAASADATTYNLAAADNFNANVPQGDTSDATATITVSAVAPTVTVPATSVEVNAPTQVVSGLYYSTGPTTLSLYVDNDNDGDADVLEGTDTITAGAWSITATLAADTVFNYIVVADQGGGNESVHVDVPTITEDSTVPVGYSAIIDAAVSAGNATALSFTFAGAEVGTTYNYTISTDGGAGTATGSGTIATATDQITGVNVSAVEDGTLTLSVTLTDDASNIGVAAVDTENKNTIVPVPVPSNNAPIIRGVPVTVALSNVLYSFQLKATDVDDNTLTFSIDNNPAWLTVNSVTGTVSGTPDDADEGITTGIVASVSDGIEVVSLAAFDIAVSVLADLDGDGIADEVDPDIDGDGIDNDFETANGLDPRDPADALTDLDGDGVDNLTEYLEDMNVALDDVAPLIDASADITLNATGLFTEVTADVLGTAVALDGLDGELAVTSNAKSHYEPGVNIVIWRATDAAGNKASAEQKVNIVPLAEFSKDQTVAENSGQVAFNVILNGDAVTYPVTVPYVVSGTAEIGSDHTLQSGIAVIESGRTITINLSLVDDGITGEAIETIDVTMEAPMNAIMGPKNAHHMRVIEGNVAPVVMLTASQNSTLTRTVTQGSANIMVVADVQDTNPNDTHSYEWLATALVDMDSDINTFTFSPTDQGVFTLQVNVMDNGSPIEMNSSVITINVVAALPVLGSTDSDQDGVDDETEGYGDADSDGIPDYLDASNARDNTLPEQAGVFNQFVIESEPGLKLSLGTSAFELNRGKASLTEEEVITTGSGVTSDEEYEFGSGLFDFIVDGIPDAGLSVDIVIPQFVQIPSNSIYRKLMPTGWQNFVEDANNTLSSAAGSSGYCPPPGDVAYASGLIVGHWCVQLNIEDGGPNDADGEADNRVTDPGGVAQLVESDPVVPDPVVPEPVIPEPVAPVVPESTTPTGPTTTAVHSSGGGSVGLTLLGMLLLLGASKNYRPRRGLLSLMMVSGGLTLMLPSQESYAVDWQAITDKSFVEFEVFAAEGSQDRGDFSSDMANSGVDVNVTAYDVTRTGYQLSLGYTYNTYATFLLGYTDLGDVQVDFDAFTTDEALIQSALAKSHPLTGDGLSIAYRYRHNVIENLSVFADAGVFFWNSDVDTQGVNGAPDIEGGADPVLALGIDYAVLNKTSVGLKYRYHRLDDQNLNGLGLLVRVNF